jgi:hypothetical protein
MYYSEAQLPYRHVRTKYSVVLYRREDSEAPGTAATSSSSTSVDRGSSLTHTQVRAWEDGIVESRYVHIRTGRGSRETYGTRSASE